MQFFQVVHRPEGYQPLPLSLHSTPFDIVHSHSANGTNMNKYPSTCVLMLGWLTLREREFQQSIQPALAYEDASWVESSAKLRMATRQWQTAFWFLCHTKNTAWYHQLHQRLDWTNQTFQKAFSFFPVHPVSTWLGDHDSQVQVWPAVEHENSISATKAIFFGSQNPTIR